MALKSIHMLVLEWFHWSDYVLCSGVNEAYVSFLHLEISLKFLPLFLQAVLIPSQLRYFLNPKSHRRVKWMRRKGEGGDNLSCCDLFWHQSSLFYSSLSLSIRFLHIINQADKVGCSCDTRSASVLPPFCERKTDMATREKVWHKFTEI